MSNMTLRKNEYFDPYEKRMRCYECQDCAAGIPRMIYDNYELRSTVTRKIYCMKTDRTIDPDEIACVDFEKVS